MRLNHATSLISLCLLASLAACTPKPSAEDADAITQSVIGVDLTHGGPFDAAATAQLGAPFSDGEASAQADLPHLTITRGAFEDSGVVENILDNTSKPFLAGISYLHFVPIVAETNKDAKTYWLVGVNMTRTPDRSLYIVLRYPKGLDIQPGLSSDDFEYAQLTCDDLAVARRPADYYAPQKEDAADKPEPTPDPAPEAGDCEFNSQAEAKTMTALVLKRYDQIKHFEDAPTKYWQAVHVEAK